MIRIYWGGDRAPFLHNNIYSVGLRAAYRASAPNTVLSEVIYMSQGPRKHNSDAINHHSRKRTAENTQQQQIRTLGASAPNVGPPPGYRGGPIGGKGSYPNAPPGTRRAYEPSGAQGSGQGPASPSQEASSSASIPSRTDSRVDISFQSLHTELYSPMIHVTILGHSLENVSF